MNGTRAEPGSSMKSLSAECRGTGSLSASSSGRRPSVLCEEEADFCECDLPEGIDELARGGVLGKSVLAAPSESLEKR